MCILRALNAYEFDFQEQHSGFAWVKSSQIPATEEIVQANNKAIIKNPPDWTFVWGNAPVTPHHDGIMENTADHVRYLRIS